MARCWCALGLGVLDFGGIVLTSSGLPPRRLPASDQAQAFGVLAVTLVGAPWLVLASTALAQTEPRPWSSAAAVWLMMRMAHGSAFSQGQPGGNALSFSSGVNPYPNNQSILPCMKETGKKTV